MHPDMDAQLFSWSSLKIMLMMVGFTNDCHFVEKASVSLFSFESEREGEGE